MPVPIKNVICYYRVSTERQGKSGLGLEAQEYCVRDFAVRNGFCVLGEFTEVESGRCDTRPILQQALTSCKKLRATLLIAKLDRLSRNVSFVSALLESKVDFIDIEMPSADEFFIIVKAAYAQKEAKEISKRTKAGLQAAKARGRELGKNGKYVLSVKNREAADRFAMAMKPHIEKLNAKGIKTSRQIARELNRRRVATFQGKGHRWHHCTVYHLLARIKKIEQMNM